MKIQWQHVEHMRKAMLPALRTMPKPSEYAAQGRISGDPYKRHRWDAFYKAQLVPYACSVLYKYANDNHIDTALQVIVRDFLKENP
jgi:hypothetical protein